MTITLISPEEHSVLQGIYQDYPALSFQNNGYEYIDMSKLTEEDLKAHAEVTAILRKSVLGFQRFNNFNTNKAGEVRLRFQYDWTADDPDSRTGFTGVGYILLDELLNGFKEGPHDE